MPRLRPFAVRRTASLAALTFATLGLAACASARHRPVQGEHAEFVLGSSSFFSSGMSRTEVRQAGAGNAPKNRALTPNAPWLGTIGLRSLLPGAYEYGFGLCLPNLQPPARDTVPVERMRALGIGLWLQFEF